MTRSRRGQRGRRRGGRREDERAARDDAPREREPHRRQHDSLQSAGAPARASAAEDASRVASRQARSRPLRQLLEGIGTPEPSVFKPDPFQLEALAALEAEDVLVTAPTGSGKTWIAREEIRRLLAAGKRAWYTSPLKALTNSKYHEFCDEFDERGHFNTDIARFMQTARSERQSSHTRFRSGPQSRRPGLPEMPPSILLAALGSYDLLPAIVFLPTRRRCDEAATEAAFAPRRG